MSFKPDQQNTCCNISFIQIVANELGGKLHGPEPAEYYTGLIRGHWWVDVLIHDTDPFYGAKRAGNKWVDEATGKVGCGPTGVAASLTDRPNAPGQALRGARSGNGDWMTLFETCAVCIDTGHVYGCVSFFFKIPDGRNSKLEMYPPRRVYSPGSNWAKTVGRWNAVAAEKGWTQFP